MILKKYKDKITNDLKELGCDPNDFTLETISHADNRQSLVIHFRDTPFYFSIHQSSADNLHQCTIDYVTFTPDYKVRPVHMFFSFGEIQNSIRNWIEHELNIYLEEQQVSIISLTKRPIIPIPKNEKKMERKEDNRHGTHFKISHELFWTIATTIVGAVFLLGFYFGQSKFDREKSEYYEESRQLRQEEMKLKESLTKKDSLNVLLKDSLQELNKDLQTSKLLLEKKRK